MREVHTNLNDICKHVIHTYIHIYIHTYIQTRSTILTYKHGCIHTYYIQNIHTYKHIYVYTLTPIYVHMSRFIGKIIQGQGIYKNNITAPPPFRQNATTHSSFIFLYISIDRDQTDWQTDRQSLAFKGICHFLGIFIL